MSALEYPGLESLLDGALSSLQEACLLTAAREGSAATATRLASLEAAVRSELECLRRERTERPAASP
jgi:hypothetical protein